MVKCVIFDFDGTLVDSNTIKRQTYYKVMEALGDFGRIIDDVLVSAAGKNRYTVFREVSERLAALGELPSGKSPEEWGALLASRYSGICEKEISECPEIPGATGTLRYLSSEGYLLFVNSSTPIDPLNRLLHLRSLKKYFSEVYGSPASKIENLYTIAKKYKRLAHEFVVVGDGSDDQEAAYVIGCHFIGVKTGNSRFDRTPLYATQDMIGIKDILSQINRQIH